MEMVPIFIRGWGKILKRYFASGAPRTWVCEWGQKPGFSIDLCYVGNLVSYKITLPPETGFLLETRFLQPLHAYMPVFLSGSRGAGI